MAKARVGEDGVYERLFCDPVEITLRLKIDVSDEPDDLKEETAEFLRKLVSEDETVRAVATEDIVWALAMRCDAVHGCMSCDSETLDALDNCGEIGAVDLLADEDTLALATEYHYAEDCRKRKAAKSDTSNDQAEGSE
ncbi:MAG: hypothetical protein ABIH23_36315 [bacterium]